MRATLSQETPGHSVGQAAPRRAAGGPSARDLVGLQRLAGNRGVADLVARERAPNPETFGPVVQPRRSALGTPGKAVLGSLNQGLGYSYKSATYEADVWAGVQARYGTSVAKGRGLWAKLHRERRAFRTDPSGLSATLSAVRHDYDRRYRNHYLTSVSAEGDSGNYVAFSSGYTSPETKPAKPSETTYHNRILLSDNILELVHNYASQDEARLQDEKAKGGADKEAGYRQIGLPSSEILWRQFMQVAREQFFVRREARAQALATQIAGVVVQQSVNVPTNQVVFVAYPDGEMWETHDRTWTPDATEEEFKAILATPNAAPAIFLLLDHLDELGDRSIASITTRGGKDRIIDIAFTLAPPAPSDYTVAMAMAALVAALTLSGYFFW